VILFWLGGGPEHMEAWGPKPAAVPGIQLDERLPAQDRASTANRPASW
jgi:hypothetical protein